MNDCYHCKNMGKVQGDCHIRCKKPDPGMTGNEHGIRNGWFMYPYLFDPIWATKECCNYETKKQQVQAEAE